MSMFHELMMRKKEQIMYATIKGTLTENDGVFSGFSTSNYLKLQQPFNPLSQNYEVVVTFELQQQANNYMFTSQIGKTVGTRYGVVLLYSYNKIILRTGTSTTGFTTLQGDYSLQNNKKYKIKFGYDGSKRYIYVFDNNSWVLVAEEESNLPTVNLTYSYFGLFNGWQEGIQYVFTGKLYLNETSITIGATKYKLQAVVGYTIVGSPTITDGVVSGFSSANYLSMGYGKVPDLNNDFEMQCKFTTGNSVENGGLISSNNYYRNGFMVYNGKVCFTIYFNSASRECYVNTNLSTNTTYIVYAKRTENNLSVILYDENKTIINTNTMSINGTISLPAFCYIGYGNQASAFNGSIDLNETYIKVDNKLWFNGQQA